MAETTSTDHAVHQAQVTSAPRPLEPQWLAALVHKVPVGIVVIDDKGTIVWCNEELCVQFRCAARDLIGTAIERLLPERFRQNHVLYRKVYTGQPMARPMGTGRALHGLRSDGTEFPVEIGLRPLDTAEGPRFVATVVDITARRNAEDTFQRVIEAAPCGMLVLDREQYIQLVNEQLLATFGYTRQQLLGEPLEMLIPDRHHGAHRGHVAAFTRNPSTRSMGPGRDLTGKHSDGTEFPVEIGLRPVQLHSGPCVLATVIDVTDRKRVELHLRRANADLEEFAYAASHDLRTPLRGISDLSDWIAEDLDAGAGEQIHNNLKRLKVRSQRMDELIASMLEYARAGADRSEIENVKVEPWLREIRDMANPGPKARITVRSSVPQMSVQKTPLTSRSYGRISFKPVSWATNSCKLGTGITSMPGIRAASSAFTCGTKTRANFWERARAAIDRMPLVWRTVPSRDSSPIKMASSNLSGQICWEAARMPTAMGRS
jgi:PAS domain S-box-containing protein